MALLTSERISQLAIELLTRNLVLANTVARVPGSEYSGPSGGTVTVRVPQPRTANEQATPGATITYTDVDEVPVNVVVAHYYDATHVTDEDRSLNLEDFGRQVLRSQVASVAKRGETELSAVMNAQATSATQLLADGSNVEAVVLQMREALTTAEVPLGDRTLACSPSVITKLLALDKFTRVDASGSRTALADATHGRVYGFMVVESPALTAGTVLGYHASAFAFASLAPVAPSTADSTSRTEGGVSLRHILQYDPNVLSDASVVSTFAGASLVEAARFEKADTAA